MHCLPVTDFCTKQRQSCGFAKHEESHKNVFNSVLYRYYLKLFLMNKITKSAVNTVLLTTITGLKIQIDLIYLQ